MAQTQRLSLTTTSLQNVVISNQSDSIYYEIVTPKWEPGTTRISKMDPRTHELETIAELQNDEDKITAVRLRGEQYRPTKDFLKEATNQSGSFRGKDGKHYQWQVEKGKLQLTKQNEPESKPVAIYHRHKRYFMVLRMSRQPYLEIQPAVMETLDSLIVSFLVMERERKDKKKR